MLSDLLDNRVVVRPKPSKEQPQHLCLDAAYDNGPAHEVVIKEGYDGHIAPKKGRDESLPQHPGARRVVG